LADEDLYSLLKQLNGVYFTGGCLKLINPVTGEQHQYYKTAKKIFEYSIQMKDDQDIVFPLFGICQGFEVLGLLASGDKKDLLKTIP
jgi:gamma-glutamyl-gamma-aminobutyrate hydrolase PuuD